VAICASFAHAPKKGGIRPHGNKTQGKQSPLCVRAAGPNFGKLTTKGTVMTWTTPILVEICIGLEINGYLPAEF
jgi:coenzyme PQQ precursor peptide PqqA